MIKNYACHNNKQGLRHKCSMNYYLYADFVILYLIMNQTLNHCIGIPVMRMC